ncbi:DUF4910 domain-containing protein [Palaeococcus ferrophilus]|uniref:DUF4910 domain-containing protein n=1 Tax=Palaeococcus ferrophilus TaxID=83868 RepID=UPI00064EA999|nr:DUF4910 domain-containing protein [Palaeococcus ferrophilus]
MRRFLGEAVLSVDNVMEFIGDISRFHRIQGSRELVEAARYVKEKLDLFGVRAEIIEKSYDGESQYLTLRSPIAWNLLHGELEFGEKRLTSAETPLVAMAHSPGGSFEGEVFIPRTEEDWERVEGKAVLVGRDWREAYRRANEKGAAAFIAYREGTGTAVPYIGLFLTGKDLEWAKIPAFAVPETWAKEAFSKDITAKGRLEVEIKEREVLPIVYAEVGSAPFVLFTAHLCHPRPGANDNASGSAMLIELARILSTLHNDSFRFGFAFLWVPEYYGTQAFVEEIDISKYYAVINLDMVAGSQDRSGSTIMAIRTPLSRFSVVSGLLEYFLDRANVSGSSFSGSPMPRLRLKGSPYEMGSDHDVFNFFGVPSVMAITWPDRHYHSSADTVEKLSRESVGIIGRAVLATALALARAEDEELRRFARAYAMKYLGELGMEGETDVSERLVMKGLARDARFLGIDVGHAFEGSGWLRWVKRGRISREAIAMADEELARRFRKLTRDRKLLVHLHELVMLSEILPEKEAFRALREEYREINEEKLKEGVDILKKAGIVEEIS